MTKTNINAKIGRFPYRLPTNLEIFKTSFLNQPSVDTACSNALMCPYAKENA